MTDLPFDSAPLDAARRARIDAPEAAPCALLQAAVDDATEAVCKPIRRKRVAFALWFGGLIGATAVIAMAAAPLLNP